ncbi:MAG: hypothetical protein L6R28_04585 [Planctomycetes bacterium]|nr:hypothetical protein [Planctomycetota bacterium]
MNRLTSVLLASFCCACFCAAAEEGAKPAPKPAPKAGSEAADLPEIYTLAELLEKADLIVLGEVSDADGIGSRIKVLDLLKQPEDPAVKKMTEPAREKLAEERLALLAAGKEPKAEDEQKEEKLKAATVLPALAVEAAGRMRVPAAGTQGLFFLWERIDGSKEVPLRYRLAHPQCLYDPSYAATAKVALARGRFLDRTVYLRDWDEKMARRGAEASADDAIRAHAAGADENGMRLKALSPRRSVHRNDNSFSVVVEFENLLGRDVYFFDGMQSNFGVRLRKKDAAPETAVVLRVKMKNVTEGVDGGTLELLDYGDFALLAKGKTCTRTLYFDAPDHLGVKELDGEYLVAGFYASTVEGKGVKNLNTLAWTGTLLTQEVPLAFSKDGTQPVQRRYTPPKRAAKSEGEGEKDNAAAKTEPAPAAPAAQVVPVEPAEAKAEK